MLNLTEIRCLKSSKIFVLLLISAVFVSCSDECPELQIANQSFEVVENADKGTVIGKVQSGEPLNSVSILSGNDTGTLTVESDGTIIVNDPQNLDYETNKQFELLLAASSACSSTEFQVTILVQDEDDLIYRDEFFKNIRVDSDVIYGDTLPERQIMKVYVPEDNLNRRPLLVMAVGGGQAFGFLEDIGQTVGKAGYVVATINYGPIDETLDPLVRNIISVQDLRAAIRYFRKDAAEGDVYKIDPEKIFAGGFGFGAFTAHRMAYATSSDVDQESLTVIEENGGFEGDRGNPGYSSEFLAMVTMSGGIDQLEFIDEGESPLIMIHDSQDTEVPCDVGDFGEGTPFYGSCSIMERATEVNIINDLILIESTGVDPHDAPAFCVECYDEVLRFFYQFL